MSFFFVSPQVDRCLAVGRDLALVPDITASGAAPGGGDRPPTDNVGGGGHYPPPNLKGIYTLKLPIEASPLACTISWSHFALPTVNSWSRPRAYSASKAI